MRSRHQHDQAGGRTAPSPSLVPLKLAHLRATNRSALLRFAREDGPVSKPQAAAALGISRPTASVLVDELVSMGLLEETGYGTPGAGGGKPPVLYRFRPDGSHVLAVMLGVETMTGALCDLDGAILARRQMPTGAPDGPRAVLDRLNALTAGILKESRGKRAVRGIGIGAPGLVDPRAGLVHFSPNLPGWSRIALAEEVSRSAGLPVLVDNECRVQALAERFFGLGRDVDNFVCIETGAGIGAGVVIDGQLYRGVDGSAGEVGHTTVDPDGPRCHCGNDGCWESMAATPYMLAATGHRTLASLAADPAAGAEWGRRLGLGAANVVNAFNPQRVIFHGDVLACGEPVRAAAEAEVRRRAMPLPGARAQVLFSTLGEDAGLMGAAALVIRTLLA